MNEPTKEELVQMDFKGCIPEKFNEWRKIKKAHFCYEWDDALIWEGIPEFDACVCFSKNKK